MKRIVLICLVVLLFLCAAVFTAYPLISNYVNDKYQSVIQTEYEQRIQELDTAEIDAAKTAAQAYNAALLPVRYTKDALQAATPDYDELLNLSGNGIMGYVEIPLIDVYLPVYHGATESVLQQGVGHLTGSSLPIGGESCHTVLTGHSGVAGKRLFSDLDQLSLGDVFYLHVLDETLAYQICEINTVLPHETELLGGVDGADLCTLVTCTPYGVNTHRLLVRGSRIPYEEAARIEQAAAETAVVQSTWKQQYFTGLYIGGGAALGALLTGCAISAILTKRRKRHAQT